jgi:hypothetical protein
MATTPGFVGRPAACDLPPGDVAPQATAEEAGTLLVGSWYDCDKLRPDRGLEFLADGRYLLLDASSDGHPLRTGHAGTYQLGQGAPFAGPVNGRTTRGLRLSGLDNFSTTESSDDFVSFGRSPRAIYTGLTHYVWWPASSAAPPLATGADFRERAAHAACDELAPCCQAQHLRLKSDDCLAEARLQTTLFLERLTGPPGAPAVPRLQADRAKTCLAAVTATSKACELVIAPGLGSADEQDPCWQVATRGHGPGEACAEAIDCTPPTVGVARCTNGVCAQLVADGQIGDGCEQVGGNTGHLCDRGLVCDGSLHQCRPPGSLGAPCAGDGECEAKLDLHCKAGTCVRPAASGQACGNEGCTSGLSCSAGICIALHPTGSPCSASGECPAADSCESGRCAPRIAVGQACEPRDLDRCAPGSQCMETDGQSRGMGPGLCLPRFGLFCRAP